MNRMRGLAIAVAALAVGATVTWAYVSRPHVPDGLTRAAAVGDTTELKRVVAQGVHVDSQDRKGKTALVTAARSGHIPMVRFCSNWEPTSTCETATERHLSCPLPPKGASM